MLNKNSRIPLVYQLEQLLYLKIANGEYKLGDSLPSYGELENELGVSRITVRNALKVLKDRGILSSKRGERAYILRIPEDSLNIQTEKVSLKRKELREAEYELLGLYLAIQTPARAHLQDERCDHMICKRILQDKPIAIEKYWFPCHMRIGALKLSSWVTKTNLTENLYRQWNALPVTYQETISLGTVDALLSEHLQIPDNTPLLCIKRLSFRSSDENHPFEYREVYSDHQYFGELISVPSMETDGKKSPPNS